MFRSEEKFVDFYSHAICEIYKKKFMLYTNLVDSSDSFVHIQDFTMVNKRRILFVCLGEMKIFV